MDQFESVRKNKFQSWISTLGEEYSFKKKSEFVVLFSINIA